MLDLLDIAKSVLYPAIFIALLHRHTWESMSQARRRGPRMYQNPISEGKAISLAWELV
jgi:hypothetical protein